VTLGPVLPGDRPELARTCPFCRSAQIRRIPDSVSGVRLHRCQRCGSRIRDEDLRLVARLGRRSPPDSGPFALATARVLPEFRPLDTRPWARFREICEAWRRRG
jgi:hypothetical protein